jgi:hypothetical protein
MGVFTQRLGVVEAIASAAGGTSAACGALAAAWASCWPGATARGAAASAAAAATGAIAATAATGSATAATRSATAIALRGFTSTHPFHHFTARCFGCSLHHVATGRLASAAPNGLAAHGDRLGAFAFVGAKAVDDAHRNRLLGKALDVHHEALFVHAD